jgi:hypothetical protein
MNKMNKYPIYLFWVMLVFLAGCLKEQENLFSEPAAVRLNNAISGIDSSLTKASNGWIMQYFATSESPGYSVLVKFNATGEVVVAANNGLVKNRYTEAKSLYDVIGDNGPVITFNTYNDVLHLFSNPVNPDGTGLNGDYEFVVLDFSDSVMHLNGKKRGSDILMIKLPEGVSWVDYLDGLKNIDTEIFGPEPLYFISGSDTYLASNGDSHIFQMQPSGGGDATYIPFIVTSDGLKFYSAFTTGNGKKVQSFYLNADRTKIISREDINTFFTATDLNLYLENSVETFAFDTTRMSDHFKYPVRVLCQQMKERYGGKRNIDFIALSYEAGFGHSFFFSTKPTITVANFSIELIADDKLPNLITINKVDGVYDPNGALFISSVTAINEAWQVLAGSYQLTSTLSRNEIKFVDKNDPTRFFVVIKK